MLRKLFSNDAVTFLFQNISGKICNKSFSRAETRFSARSAIAERKEGDRCRAESRAKPRECACVHRWKGAKYARQICLSPNNRSKWAELYRERRGRERSRPIIEKRQGQRKSAIPRSFFSVPWTLADHAPLRLKSREDPTPTEKLSPVSERVIYPLLFAELPISATLQKALMSILLTNKRHDP